MSLDTIAFIGLGNMGLPMAVNLARAGCRVMGFDPELSADTAGLPANLLLHGSLENAIADAGLIMTMLPSGDVVLSVLQAIIEAGARPMAVVDCSTIDIEHARQAHAMAREAGLGFIDAPVSGGIAGAAAGTLTTMTGGDKALLDQVKPALQAVFKTFVHCGEGGAGQAAKICNNMLLATTMIGAGEAFNLGRKLGLDPNTLFSVLSTSTGSCWSVNQYCPVPGTGPESPADNDYKPGFSAQMMLKDLKLTQNAAQAAFQATPMGAQALALYEAYTREGGASEDFSGIIRFLDSLERS